ncbi:MAG: T9SS type A sorting domain-containing protein [Aureispira sp.]
MGTRLNITAPALTLTNQGTGTNSGVQGTVSFTIPNNAASGTVIFIDGNGTPIDTTDYSLVIHNPTLDFTTLPSLLCASNTAISLNATPAGGTFTGIGTAAGAVSGDTLDATQMPWPTAHSTSLAARIGYAYTPTYSDNTTPCAQAIGMTRTLPIYDNRLNRVEFATLSQQDAVAGNKVLSLDTSLSNMITLVTPNIFCNSNPNSAIVPCLPHTFSGTFIDQNNNFLSTIAGGRNLVTLEYNNQGCIGSADGFIDILGKLVIQNLPDTLCASSGIATFGRDTNLVYLDTTLVIGTETRRILRNELLSTYTSDPNNSAAINPVSLIQGQEQFDFDPIFNKVIVNMQYQNLTTVTDALGVVTTLVADTFVVTDSVVRTGANQSILFINNLKSSYCANEMGDTLFPSLGFVGLSSNIIYVYRSSTNDTIYLDNHYLNPAVVYDSLVPSGIGNLDLRVGYEIDYYGCDDRLPFVDQPLVTITAPQTPSFMSQSPYCRGDAPDLLQRAALGTGVSEAFSGSGVDPATGIFNPRSAGIGNNTITYVLSDSNGCTYFYTNDLIVNNGPEVNLLLNGSTLTNEFCYSVDSVGLDTTFTSRPNTLTSILFFGAGIRVVGTDTFFDPSIVYSNGDTATTVWVEVTDAVGCFSSDTAYITVIPPPAIDIDSAFNFVSSIYGINGLDTSHHSYCQSIDTFFIDGQPSYTTGNTGTSITGDGVVLIGNNFYYDPSLINGGEVDTVLFTYTDVNHCQNIDTAIIKIDSIPVVTLTGLPSNLLCNNKDTIPLIGSPIDTFNNRGTFIGAGVDSLSGIFVPADAGIGTHILIYDYTATSGCSNRDSIQVTIVNKPTSEPRGYQPSYCINAANDTLFSANDTSGSYQFSGDLIIAGTDILTVSNLPDTNTILLRDLYYTYTSATGCTINDTITIQINPKPEIYFNDLDTAYCANGTAQNFRVSPNGGSLIHTDSAFSILTDNRFIEFNPMLTDTGYTSLTYTFTAPNTCADTVTTPVYVQPVVLPSIAGLDSFYCKTNDTIPLTASLSGGYFIGSGVGSNTNRGWFFIPNNAQNGANRIQYIIPGQVTAPGQALVCRTDTTVIVNIEAPLNINLASPSLVSKFCSSDPAVQFLYDTLSAAVVHTFRADTSTSDSAVVWSANTYFFDPSNASIGANVIIYAVEDTITGCKDSTEHIFVVDEYIVPRIRNLDSSYCEEDEIIAISGIPSGSTITRDGVPIPPINPQIPNRLAFRPNGLGLPLNPLTSSIKDTIVCSYTQGGCSDSVTIIVDIHPVFNVDFTVDSNNLQKIFCLGGDTVDLIPSTSGGFFSGTGVRSGTTFFIPDLAEAGIHPIKFEYTDSVTSCYSEFTDTFYVYGVPNLDFAVQGGCQFDSIEFVPNNALLGLDNIFQNNFIDSVTSVLWYMSDSVQIVGSGQRDSITPLHYQYASPGVYNTQLMVANREVCVDTQTIRIVISPKISTFPYVEDFETDNGNWFAESRDSTHRLLWEWGIDSTSQGGPNDNSNHIWATQTNASYAESEDAWVYSPCFDISNLDRPMISLNFWSNVRPSDGAILEYQGADGRWLPLGAVNRGIDWYNSGAVYARPGDQVLPGSATSMGWIGLQQFDWKDGRCKLDGIAYNSSTRFRIAFASLPNPINSFLDGFAFDNVVIRSRTRNVLIETMVNDRYEDTVGLAVGIEMETINNANYQLIHHTELNKDVVLLQYHIERANGTVTGGSDDFFHLHNPDLGKTRSFEYSATPGKAYIDGTDSAYTTRFLTEVDFEQDMLETPKFAISIDTFRHINNNFQIVARATALIDTMAAADYRIYTVISEDSLSYPRGSGYNSLVHAVVRENDEYHLNPFRSTSNIINNHTWTIGETERVEFNWNHSANSFINYRPNRFHAVVFIQNIATKEIFQVATSRDVSGYWIGINPIEAEEELNELQSLKLFPNPAHDYFNLQFDQALEHDYEWKLVNMQGVEVKQGQLQMGTDQVRINGLDYPSGTYILLLYNNNVFVQRKVILGRP